MCKQCGAKRPSVPEVSASRALIADTPASACAFDQAARIGNRAFGQAQRKRMFADAVEDRVALGDRQGDQTEGDAITLKHAGVVLGLAHRLVETLGETLGFRAQQIVRQFELGRGIPHVVAHGLQGHRDHLVGQCLIDGREPVESETADHLAQGGPLDDQRKQRETRGENADQTLDLDRDRRVFGDRKRQRQRHRAAQATPENRHAIRHINHRREPQQRQQRHQPEEDGGTRRDGGSDNDQDQPDVADFHRFEQPRNQQRGEDEDQRPGPVRQQIPGFAQIRP